MARAPAQAAKKTRVALTEEEKTPRGAFVRLAQGRMNQAIKAIRALANLSGANYDYNAQDVDKMKQSLAAELNATFRRLTERKAATKTGGFTL